MLPRQPIRRFVLVLAIGSLLLSACGGNSKADLAKAKAAGVAEQVATQKDKSQADEQVRLAAEVKKLQTAEQVRLAEAKKLQTAEQVRVAAEVKKLQTEAAKVQKQAETPSVSVAPANTSCGGNLSVGSNTSCAFAANVESTFYNAGGGTNRIDVYSPVTGTYYLMTCVAGIPTVCRGGNNAVVYIR